MAYQTCVSSAISTCREALFACTYLPTSNNYFPGSESQYLWIVVIDCGLILDITFIVIIIIIGRVETSLPTCSCTTGPRCLYVTVCMYIQRERKPNFVEEIVLLPKLRQLNKAPCSG